MLLAFTLMGVRDLLQRRHSLARNYPAMWIFRYLFESIRPQIRQYLIESDTDGKPFDREQRSLVYQRAKNVMDTMPFGTERDVKAPGFEWINHSMAPKAKVDDDTRIEIGGDACSKPYSASVLNISAMSFGSLSAAAIRALNKGAKIGGFAHDTGEGGISPYHLEAGGDLIWEVGSGYYGCRDSKGKFDPEMFRDRATGDTVKMIEIKLSQGAKPGHGGMLPAAKITAEIAATRGIPQGVDCLSPAAHSAFSTPIEMMEFIAQLRELSGGKPVGFKLCVGHPYEFFAVCKAMRETGITPDFIVVDGKEGGTGAAPVEFTDHVGMPRREGMLLVQNALVGCGLREQIKIGTSGKIISGFDMALTMALGADWCNSARGFMFSLGCLQSQHCHTNQCPVGIATQDPSRQRGLDVADKAQRVANFHHHTVVALNDIVAAAGLSHPFELAPEHIQHRTQSGDNMSLAEAYEWLQPRQLLDGVVPARFQESWRRANPSSF